MQKVITEPKIKLSLEKTSPDILKVWEKAFGIWKRKKLEPIRYLRKIRKEWKRTNF